MSMNVVASAQTESNEGGNEYDNSNIRINVDIIVLSRQIMHTHTLTTHNRHIYVAYTDDRKSNRTSKQN